MNHGDTELNPNPKLGSTPAPGVAGRTSRPATLSALVCQHALNSTMHSVFSARARKTAPEAGALPVSTSSFRLNHQPTKPGDCE